MASSNEDIIRIMCPNLGCQRILAVPPRAQGRVVRCRGCGTNIRVPHPEGQGMKRAATEADPQKAA